MNKLFVGGLPYSTTEDSLRAAFEQAGAVTSASIIIDRATGRSKGFGFVEMADKAGMDNAIAMFDGKDFEGRRIAVSEARPKTDDAPRFRRFEN
jgi:RNA recognition motif-containing protein